mmetsp:Transcript_2364/g.8410  ORF Transcript_2364/g.8410 Transcript_2364/m.8410 type:complete len:351 (-) Transcript_2364:495-1547(-)
MCSTSLGTSTGFSSSWSTMTDTLFSLVIVTLSVGSSSTNKGLNAITSSSSSCCLALLLVFFARFFGFLPLFETAPSLELFLVDALRLLPELPFLCGFNWSSTDSSSSVHGMTASDVAGDVGSVDGSQSVSTQTLSSSSSALFTVPRLAILFIACACATVTSEFSVGILATVATVVFSVAVLDLPLFGTVGSGLVGASLLLPPPRSSAVAISCVVRASCIRRSASSVVSCSAVRRRIFHSYSAWRKRSAMACRLLSSATCRGVPFRPTFSGEAPASRKRSTSSALFMRAAMCRGDSPYLFANPGFAPASSSCLAARFLLPMAAKWSTVSPSRLVRLTRPEECSISIERTGT